MEWVSNTSCELVRAQYNRLYFNILIGLRALIMEAHAMDPERYPYIDLRRIKDSYEEMQMKYSESNLDDLLIEYRRLVLEKYILQLIAGLFFICV
jgi:hypothetical protein